MLQFYYRSVVRCLCGSMCLLHAGAHCSVPSAQCSLHAKVTEVPRLDTVKLLDGGGGWGAQGFVTVTECLRLPEVHFMPGDDHVISELARDWWITSEFHTCPSVLHR